MTLPIVRKMDWTCFAFVPCVSLVLLLLAWYVGGEMECAPRKGKRETYTADYGTHFG